ncbi:MAG: ferric reductase-like transmembrane domain-containing protein [bacterium]
MAGGRLRSLGVLVAVAIVAVALGQAQTSGPTDLESSRCWTCHKVGGTVEGTPLKVMYSLHPPGSLALAPGTPTPLNLEVRNDWLANLHNIVGTLDLSKAPSLAFQPPPAPVTGVHVDGSLPFTATQLNQPERTTVLKLPVPAGATDIRVTLSPTRTTGADAPDLALRIWGDGIFAQPATARSVDNAGKGLPEVFHTKDADTIGALGYGNWSVAAVQAGFSTKPDAAALEEQGFSIAIDAWFNLTGDRTQFVGSTARLDGKSDGPHSTTLTWNLFVRAPPHVGEELVFTVNAVASFQHPAQFNAVDDWAFTQTLHVPIQPPPPTTDTGGPPPLTNIQLNTTPTPDTALEVDHLVITEKAVGEAVGYFTAFVMVVSLVTGGIFGSASRRGLNRILTSAQRRIAFHNLTSYLILIAAAAHTYLFIHEAEFPWTLGLLWGGLGILALAALGVTGAWQLPLIRSWHYGPWRVVHYTCAVLAVVFTLLHMGLDGIHFTNLQKDVGWQDPVGKWLGTTA